MKAFCYALSVLLVSVILYKCGSAKLPENEEAVRTYLAEFEKDLDALDAELFVAKHLKETNRSKQAVVNVVNVLKNIDSLNVIVRVDYFNFAHRTLAAGSEVVLTGTLETAGDEGKIRITSSIKFEFQEVDGVLKIKDFDAQDFYRDYLHVKNEKEWAAERVKELQLRQPYYDTALQLESKYDSVLWFWSLNSKTYYTVVQGTWDMKNAHLNDERSYKMGVVNAKGDTIVPIEYDMVGTINFPFKGYVEIRKDGLVGYYDFAADSVLVSPDHMMIVPYKSDTISALVNNGSDGYGWLTKKFELVKGDLPAEAQKYLKDFLFLQEKIVLNKDNFILAEIPAKEYAGSGIIVPPHFYVANNLFPEVIEGIRTTKVPMNGWTDEIENTSIINKISEGVRAIVTVVGERYVGGRESFYGESSVQLLDERDTVLAVTQFSTDGAIEFNHPDPFLLELKANSVDYLVHCPGGERGAPEYKYYRVDADGRLELLESNRVFNFTEFVRIDSSYISGPFMLDANEEGEGEGVMISDDYGYYKELEFYTDESIRFMIDEIYASYGYVDPNANHGGFTLRVRESEKVNSPAEAESKFSAVDVYNVAFLKKYLADKIAGESGI